MEPGVTKHHNDLLDIPIPARNIRIRQILEIANDQRKPVTQKHTIYNFSDRK